MRLYVLLCCCLWITFSKAQNSIEVEYYAPIENANGAYTKAATHYTLVCDARSSIFISRSLGNQVDYDGETQKIAVNFNPGNNWLFKDNAARALTNYVTSFREKHFLIEDKLHPVKWEILQEEKIIGGLAVQKARGKLRGRTYTAWFAPSISIGNGPWKLGGLPGLILEAYDDEKIVVFLFKSIRQLPARTIHLPDSSASKISLKEYNHLYQEEVQQYYNFLNAQLQKEGSNVSYQTSKFAHWEYLE